MVHKKVWIDISPRYFVMGVYKDRDEPILRFYPCPFIRISWEMA
jgi:hypothetical protein